MVAAGGGGGMGYLWSALKILTLGRARVLTSVLL